MSLLSGCRIPVVRLLWEQVDWVQFPAAREKTDTQHSFRLRVLWKYEKHRSPARHG